MCRRAPSRRCMWFIKRTPIRDFYEHAMWERCQLRAREHGCNFRRARCLTADSGFLQRFCCLARKGDPARGAGRAGGPRCVFWYVDVGVPCATRRRPSGSRWRRRSSRRELRMQQRCNTWRCAREQSARLAQVTSTSRGAHRSHQHVRERVPANCAQRAESRDPNRRRAGMTAVQRCVALRRCARAARVVQS